MCRFSAIIVFILTFQICITSVFSQSADTVVKDKPVPLTFDAAFARMINSNESIAAAKHEEEQRLGEKSAAFGLYFPKIEAKANAYQLSDPVVMDLNDIRTAIIASHAVQGAAYQQALNNQLPEFKRTLVEDRFAKVDAAISGPIFTGGKIIAANNAANARIEESKQKTIDTKNRLVTELVNRYFGLRLASRVVEVRKMVLDGMEKHLNDAKSLERNGMIARVERLHAEVAFSDAEREFKKSERIMSITLTALNNTLSSHETFEPVTPLFICPEIQSLAHYQKSAVENNPLLKQIAANKDLAHQQYRKELASFTPNIFYFGTKQLYGYKTSDMLPNWIVGVGASATIFEGFGGYNKVKAAKSQEERVAALESKARKDILTLVEKNYQELMTALEQFNSIQASFKFSEEYLRVREKAFAEGAATSLDVVDAQMAFSKVKIDRLKAVYDYDIALSSLLEASGLSSQFGILCNSKNLEVGF